MFTRTFHLARFLRWVYGTEPFVDYCRLRQIPFAQALAAPPQPGDAARWADALSRLPHERQGQVELELAKVNELAGPEAAAHLLQAAEGKPLPPDLIPGGAALALWFFLHHADLFQEVFFQHEIREVDSWRTAKAASGLAVADLTAAKRLLAEEVQAFFALREGSGRFCTIDAHRLPEALCFVAQVSDRLQFVESFTDGGEPMTQRLRPALAVLFVYRPHDGTVLVKSHLRAADRVRELLQCFGRAALGSPIDGDGDLFDLDRLKLPFRPVLDAEDMEAVRVKSLHLRYPDRLGRRQLRLDTPARDAPAAIDEMLRVHGGDRGLTDLRVSYAELQVRLRVGGRPKTYAIRLWPNRCNLNQTALGDRFRSCLRKWGLCHGG